MSKQPLNVEREYKFAIGAQWTDAMVLAKLLNCGLSTTGEPLRQKDVYWDDERCTITNLKRGLRARYVNGTCTSLEFKSLFKTAEGKQVVEEVTLLTADKTVDATALAAVLEGRFGFEKVQELGGLRNIDDYLQQYGLKPCIVLEKKRTTLHDAYHVSEISLDEIEGLPMHIEIECAGSDVVEFEKVVAAVSEALMPGLKPVKVGYLDLITSQNPKLLSAQEFDERFRANHAWNVLPTERHLVRELLTQAH